MPTHHELPFRPDCMAWGVFDAAIAPVLRIASGDSVSLKALPACIRSRLPTDPAFVIDPVLDAALDVLPPGPSAHFLSGPVHVEGAGWIVHEPFEPGLAMADEEDGPKGEAAKPEPPAEEVEPLGDQEAVRGPWVLNCGGDLVPQRGWNDLVGIKEQYPLRPDAQMVESPLALLRIPTRVLELDDLRPGGGC